MTSLLTLAVLSSGAHADEYVRVATWNIQDVGAPGTAEYEAALDVLTHVGPNVVAIQEVADSTDEANLGLLASEAGYLYWTVADSGPMGSLRTAFMSDYPLDVVQHDSSTLSGDATANDITRYMFQVTVDVTGAGDELALITSHWKSGFDDDDEYRRSIESFRAAQAAGLASLDTDAFVVMGDMNDEIDTPSHTPATFTAEPAGLPRTFRAGSDILDTLATTGLANDPFAPLAGVVSAVDALQLDGRDSTRNVATRRIDYLWVSDVLFADAVGEVYDSEDIGLAVGLPKYGADPDPSVSTLASDHLLVFVDLRVPTAGSGTVTPAVDGESLVITEVMANPLVESTGEYVEVLNNGTVDIDLAGWAIDDGDLVDALQAFDAGTVLVAGARAVIVDPGFAWEYSVPADVLLLTTSGSAICNGLSTSDPITLTAPGATTPTASYLEPFDPGNGVSAERSSERDPDGVATFAAHGCGDDSTESFGIAACP